jgi:hypothetical protein
MLIGILLPIESNQKFLWLAQECKPLLEIPSKGKDLTVLDKHCFN